MLVDQRCLREDVGNDAPGSMVYAATSKDSELVVRSTVYNATARMHSADGRRTADVTVTSRPSPNARPLLGPQDALTFDAVSRIAGHSTTITAAFVVGGAEHRTGRERDESDGRL